jgi:hypothetical protein
MPEVVDAFPPRKTASAEWWRKFADGQIWKLAEADWKERYASPESARIGGQHFGKTHGYRTRVQSVKDDDGEWVFAQFTRMRVGNSEGQVHSIEGGGNGRRKRGRPRDDEAQVTHYDEEEAD